MVRHRFSAEEPVPKITNLEMVHWVSEEESFRGQARRHGKRVASTYETFQDARNAIMEHGELVIATDRVDVIFFVAGGRYDNQILAVRQSGINVRRFLIREEHFEVSYGTFQNCIDHIMSNNAVESELEIQHLRDVFNKRGLKTSGWDEGHAHSRMDVDLVAAMQLIELFEHSFAADDEDANFVFSLAFSVGRIFSSIQNLATLEDRAHKADEYARSYRERGEKGKSSERRLQRAEDLLKRIESLISENPAMSRLPPVQVAILALEDAAIDQPKLWSQGKGQLESYLTFLASDATFRSRYNALFFGTG
jgi:hypothetical protein